MIKTYVINELKRTIAPEEAEKYPSVVIGDDSINGIEFEFPPVFEHFDLYNGVKHIIYIKPDGEKKVKLLTEMSEETGRYLWRFDDGINQGDPGVISFAMMIDEVDDEGTILKTWMSLPAKFNTVNSLAAERRDDADEEETYSERLAAAETALANMQRLISGLASGAPAVAATAADMTDTEAIYIYTGSETGYSSGHLYYYDESAWVDFGQYGAAATDSTLSIQGAPADAKATGHEIEQIKEDLSAIQTATTEDAGKALKAKTVADGKVTEWEFGEAGGDTDKTLTEPDIPADSEVTGKYIRAILNLLKGATYDQSIIGNASHIIDMLDIEILGIYTLPEPLVCNADQFIDTGFSVTSEADYGYTNDWYILLDAKIDAVSHIFGNSNWWFARQQSSANNSMLVVRNTYDFEGKIPGQILGNRYKYVITYNHSTNKLTAYGSNNASLVAASPNIVIGKNWGKLMIGGRTEASFKGTIYQLDIRLGTLTETEIKAYVGVE